MLVLSRKVGESIIVTLPGGQKVVVTLVELDRGRVRLSVCAPREVPVYRGEIIEARQKEGEPCPPQPTTSP